VCLDFGPIRGTEAMRSTAVRRAPKKNTKLYEARTATYETVKCHYKRSRRGRRELSDQTEAEKVAKESTSKDG